MNASRVKKGSTTASSEARLVEVLDAYLAAAHDGRAPAREQLLAEHPELAEDLEACLASLEFIGKASLTAPPLGAESASVEANQGEPGIGDLGDFRLVAEVGRGGMGVVYEAVQRSLDRRVALKVLPFAAAMDPVQLRRFHTEALAAAQLHHTHIVPVYSVGCERGVHYYAMQFIEGQTLAEAIAERKRADELPRETGSSANPSPSSRSKEFFRTVAALGIQAAEALDHAHKVGIVHRDIKPANLLLDVQGDLWVTDFGLARLRDDTGLTITGDLLGTLRYMSPEQALGKRGYLDHRADIYSLGTTLYELLTLRPAIDGQDRQEILRKLAHEEPTPPRKINPAIPRELETILLKAMSKEPQSRYATAQELADDLRRFLDEKPIRAKRPNLVEHAAKFARRNAHAVAALAVVLILAVAGLATGAALLAQEQRRTAQNLRLARETIEEYLTKVSESRLLDEPGLQPLRKELLEAALKNYQSLMAQRAGDRGLQSDLARAQMRVGRIKSLLGEPVEAVDAFRGALDMYRRLAAANPADDRSEIFFAEALRQLAVEYRALGNADLARTHLEQAVVIAERIAHAQPGEEERQTRLAGYYLDLGRSQELMGDLAGGEQLYRQSVMIRERIVAAHPGDANCLLHLANSQAALMQALRIAGRLGEARAVAQRVIQSYDTIGAAGEGSSNDRYELAQVLFALGGLQSDGGDAPVARRSYRRAADMLEALVAANPNVVQYRTLLGGICINMTGLDVHGPKPTKEEFDERLRAGLRAIELFRALAKSEPSVPEHDRNLVGCYNNLSLLHTKNDNPNESIACLRRALEIGEPMVATRAGLLLAGESVSLAQGNLAERLIGVNDWEAARPLYERNRGLLERLASEFPLVPAHRDRLRIALFRLSEMYLKSGRLDDAERYSRRVLVVAEEILRDHPDLALLPPTMTCLARYGSEHRDLAKILEAKGRIAEAVSLYQKAISILEDAIRRQPRDVHAPEWLAQVRESLAKAQSRVAAPGTGVSAAGDRPKPALQTPGRKEKERNPKRRSKP
jgi:serine/threonine protein kinase